MKTIKTETEKQQVVAGDYKNRNTSLNDRQEKVLLIISLLLLFIQLTLKVDAARNQWQYTISSGMHSFYAPIEHLKWDNSGFAASAGINRLLGRKEIFSLGLQAQLAGNKYQGDAASLQLLGQFTPVILKSVELGVGTGAGYRISGYPSVPVKWDGNEWKEGKMYKGIIQIPLQFSAGYRAIQVLTLGITPFVSYQLQAMFGYNPDFDPLPDSNIMFGFKFNFNNK